MPQRVGGPIELASISHQTEMENTSLPTWGLVVHLNKYAPLVRDFTGGGVIIASVIISLMLLGSGIVSLSLPSAMVLPMVLLTPLGLGTKLLEPQLPTPKSVGRATPGN